MFKNKKFMKNSIDLRKEILIAKWKIVFLFSIYEERKKIMFLYGTQCR